MKFSRPPAARVTAPPRRRGSILVLLIVSLALMAVIGATYLQVARVQRAQAGGDPGGDIDAVVDSVLALITTTLEDDVNDPAGNANEPFDYPRTNDDTAAPENTYEVYQLTTGTNAQAYGGYHDDKWLASSMPEYPADVWPNITDLTGVFLAASATDGDVSTVAAPTEYPVNHAGDVNTNIGLDVSNAGDLSLLVDADLDGINDSRWQWPPIPVIEGSAYTMAVRIVDLSGRLNLEVASSPSDDADAYDNSAIGEQAPRWLSPTGLNFGTFSSGFGGDRVEYNNYVDDRYDDTTTTPLDPYEESHGVGPAFTTQNDRQKFWTEDASELYLSWPVSDQLDLLVRNGLHDASLYGGTPGWLAIPALLRNGGAETAWDAPAAPFADEQDFFEQNPRLHTSLISGVSQTAPSGSSLAGAKVYLNPIFDPANPDYVATQTEVDTKVEAVMTGGTIPLASATPVFGAAEYAEQFTVNVSDYADADNFVTVGPNFYGFEALPFIAEIYVERPYTNTAHTPAGGPTPVSSDWNEDGETIYAIEIANPFRSPVELSDVYLTIEVPASGLGFQLISADDLLALITPAEMATFTGEADNPDTPQNEAHLLYPDRSVILVVDPDATNYATNLAASATLPAGTLVVDITNPGSVEEWPVDGVGGATETVTVGLAASSAASAAALPAVPIAVNYQEFTLETTPDALTNPSDNSLPAPGAAAPFYQSITGARGGIDMLAIGDGTAVNESLYPTTDALHVSPSEFEQADKTVPAGYAGNPFMKTGGDQQVAMSGRVDPTSPTYDTDLTAFRVGELARVTALGYSATQTVPERWEAGRVGTPAETELYPRLNGALMGGGDPGNVSHAASLLSQFTVSPRPYDPSQPPRNFRPGQLNLNTVSRETLIASMPLSDATLATNIADTILGFRDNPGGAERTAAGSSRANPGIANVWELAPALAAAFGTDGNDNALDANGVRIDFGNPTYLDAVTNAPLDDAITDDYEEQLMVTEWLSQVAGTRSDCFAAYIWVREYEATDFTQVTDERRLIAVFQRSTGGVTTLLGLLPTDP